MRNLLWQHLPIKLSQSDREELAALSGDSKVTVVLENNKVVANGKEYTFTLEDAWKNRLLKGLDSIGITLEYADKITAYEQKNG